MRPRTVLLLSLLSLTGFLAPAHAAGNARDLTWMDSLTSIQRRQSPCVRDATTLECPVGVFMLCENISSQGGTVGGCCCCATGTLCIDDLSGDPYCCDSGPPSSTAGETTSATSITPITSASVPSASTSSITTSVSLSTPTALLPSVVPSAPTGFVNVEIPPDQFTYGPVDAWKNSSDVPACSQSGNPRVSSQVGSTFSFNFTGPELFLNTIFASDGGFLELSVAGQAPKYIDTSASANTSSCAVIPAWNGTNSSLSRRTIVVRADSDAQTLCTGKVVNGSVGVDGASYRKASSSTRRCFLSYAGLLTPFLLTLLVEHPSLF